MTNISRRGILKGTLTAAAGIGALSVLPGMTADADAQVQKDASYDLIIVGCGCAGMVCAIRASELGLRPVIIEKMPSPSGNTVYSGGILLGVNTKAQTEQNKNTSDTVDKFYEDLMIVSQQRGDKVMTRYFAEHCSEALNWLSDSIGIKWMNIVTEVFPAYERSHVVDGPSKPSGSQLAKQLMQAVNDRRIPVLFNTKVVALAGTESLEVTGVKTVSKEGTKSFIARYGVVISTGGFHANNEMVTSQMGGWAANMPIRGSKIISGENFTLTRPFFPKFVNTDQFHAGPIHGPTGANPSIMVNYGILVTGDGVRYIDEVNTYVRVAKETAKTVKGNWAFIIMDSEPRGISTVEERFARYSRAKAPIYEGASIKELAAKANINATNLEKTVSEYNKAVKNKTAERLTPPNTLSAPRSVVKGPFYAIPFQGGMTATFGGPLVNVKTQVINTENQPIEGLYAIGNSVGGIFYDDYIVGAQLTSAAVFGRVCAEEIAKKRG
ncbi:MAG: FAD-dependent oxidoreductase [Deferribacteraceae bacterium]|jgi:fumarate reductase flavoprotein subunit|nr:FAD-dependent oxidoreductase [Deferribacteraceae bacterium]